MWVWGTRGMRTYEVCEEMGEQMLEQRLEQKCEIEE
jgi:hypothetical protein